MSNIKFLYIANLSRNLENVYFVHPFLETPPNYIVGVVGFESDAHINVSAQTLFLPNNKGKY